MLKPLDKDQAFAAIADDLELPIVLLCSPDPRVRLVQIEKIGAALMSTNLTWRDLAERVVAPRPAVVGPVPAALTNTRLTPVSDIHVDSDAAPPLGGPKPQSSALKSGDDKVLTNEELMAYGYRSGPGRAGYGYDNSTVPDAGEPRPSEQ